MLPLYPPYPIADLAHEHLEERLPDGRPRRQRHRDPDEFFADSTILQPDPVFMGLRKLVSGGPIGRLVQWSERKLENWEIGRNGSPTVGSGNVERAARSADAVPAADAEDHRKRKVAA